MANVHRLGLTNVVVSGAMAKRGAQCDFDSKGSGFRSFHKRCGRIELLKQSHCGNGKTHAAKELINFMDSCFG